ncbi:MAG TPA: dihydrolipoamide acetyltransferase family protein [Candidatus Bathyarchaeia archaeon]|nr:dihydrolipoamide acetyltransferase family protein [Candidatus Bathyarchaeia archaeon]
MVTRVVMPRLSLTMKEGTVVQWFKREGDVVQKGEPLVEVLSEKVTYDVEAPESGVLRKILSGEGSNVPVDQPLGLIAGANELITKEATLPEPMLPTTEAAPVVEPQKSEQVEARVPASPAARRLAKELGVDLTQVSGKGPESRIVEDDVRRFAEQIGVKPRIRETIELSGIRKTTAERLSLSARTAPHSTIIMEVDMSKAAKLRQETRLSYTEMLVKAVAKALREHRVLNATLDGEQIKVFEDINVGIAVATEDGLIVPVIRNADGKSLNEIASMANELADKARQGKLSREDLTGGTFTITNLGRYDVDVFIPIINPPETAILGVGRVVEKPVAVNGQVALKPVAQLSLAYDHRIVDGAPAAQFLKTVKRIMEEELSLGV